ncbi:MAG: CapA family protein, partial [Chloroflexi bacterium]|nr:CapA family protein [Chloroflexota bacterium]
EQNTGDIILHAVGDIKENRKDATSIFEHVASTIRKGDINFCQVESPYSDRGCPNPAATQPFRDRPENVAALKYAGFNVGSFAGNHCMDYCHDAFLDTIELLRKNDLPVAGAGKNLAEAHEPVIIETKGAKVGFLAYCSILKDGYRAEAQKPGCCPLRAFPFYEPHESDQPGHPSNIYTFAHPGDLMAMVQDVKQLRPRVDVLVVSMHFGLHQVEALLAMYQKELAHAAIDAGADLILGHHAHVVKGIEVYKGKAIFYSMGNFAFDSKLSDQARAKEKGGVIVNKFGYTIEKEWFDTYPLPAHCRKSMLVRCIISDKKIKRASFVPVLINRQAQPELQPAGSPGFEDVAKYVERVSSDQGLDTSFRARFGEVVVDTGAEKQ